MTVYNFRIGPYARSIYLDGTKTFADIPAEYDAPVTDYAARNFTSSQLDNALANNYITQEKYDETVALEASL